MNESPAAHAEKGARAVKNSKARSEKDLKKLGRTALPLRGLGYLFPAIALTIAFAVVASFSWVARMRQTGVGGEVISDDYRLFELGAVTNAAGTARNTAVANPVLDTMSTYGAQNFGRDTLETSDNKDGVICALEPSDGGALRPGSDGTLRFRLLPRTANRDYYAQMFLSGIKKIVNPSDFSTTYEVLDLTDPDDVLALDYLKGHVLFFTDSAHTTMIDDGDVLVIDGADTANSEYVVTLYWVWPRTYSDHSAYVDDAWRLTHSYLDNGTGDLGYNNADQVIGEGISHVVAELNVTGTELDTVGTQHTISATLLS